MTVLVIDDQIHVVEGILGKSWSGQGLEGLQCGGSKGDSSA